MATKTTSKRLRSRPQAHEDDIEDLYIDFLRAFYEDHNRKLAREIAKRLEYTLRAHPQLDGSIRAEEIRSLLAELRGDFDEAIRSRESEIRKIFELHSLSLNGPSRDFILQQYGFSDIGDRLDLLASLYADKGDIERAVRVLFESKHFCEAHRIPFDGQDLLNEIQRRADRMSAKAKNGRPDQRRVDLLPSANPWTFCNQLPRHY